MRRMTLQLGRGTGPLRGVRVVEIAGIGPGPHACMILADLGADVIRVERPGGQLLSGGSTMVLNRGRPSVALDLKHPEAAATVIELVRNADVLVEGMRPGVAERLGIGPEACRAANPRLVYGRMTGWGQDGPLAQAAGHDINYISVAGALFGLGQTPDRPQFPTNLVGDFGGGSTYLVIGLLAALLEARVSGHGQVVDAAIVDGTAHLNAMTSAFIASGGYHEERGANLLDGGVPFYDVYETADGRHVSVGALEPQFYAEFLRLIGLEGVQALPSQHDRDGWPELRERFAAAFKEKSRDEWAAIFLPGDACVAPVLSLEEAAQHPYNTERGVFVEQGGHAQPVPAPRFSRSIPQMGGSPALPGQHTQEVLTDLGFGDIEELLAAGVIAQA